MHRHPPARGGPGLMRPAVASGEVVGLGALAHLSAGGTLPGPDGLLAIWLVTAAACLALHLRLLRLATAIGLAVTGQVVVHVAASVVSSGAGHAHHATASATTAEPMLLAHVVSAVATVLVLVWQERALLAIVQLLLPSPARPTTAGPPAVPSRAHRARPRRLPDTTVALRRGPPRVPAAAFT